MKRMAYKVPLVRYDDHDIYEDAFPRMSWARVLLETVALFVLLAVVFMAATSVG